MSILYPVTLQTDHLVALLKMTLSHCLLKMHKDRNMYLMRIQSLLIVSSNEQQNLQVKSEEFLFQKISHL